MSAQETRNEIVREYLPKLIKSLTNFSEDDENYRQCEQFAWSIIRNHRNLSTNSHEIKRKIEGIQERFTVENYGEYAELLGRLCDEIMQDPLCINHYELDVHWSLLDLLLTLAYKPTASLRRNKRKFNFDSHLPTRTDEQQSKSETYDGRIPLRANLNSNFQFNDSDSDLSDWSDVSPPQTSFSGSCTDDEKEVPIERSYLSHELSNPLQKIKPPEKIKLFVLYEGTNAEERLMNTVQHSWWLQGLEKHPANIDSSHLQANFALVYYQFLNENSKNFRISEPETATEYSLIREIFWMFAIPATCKFFQVNNNIIKLRQNITIPSTTVTGLATILEHNFLPYIRMMNTLRLFQKSIYNEDFTPPRTIECYAASLKLLLKPIWNTLLEHEKRILAQKNFDFTTLISLKFQLRDTFVKLSNIYDIHQRSVLNILQYPAHISSAYLLAALMNYNHFASTVMESNLAISLFLASVKVFCVIIDTWWTEGRLDDWQSEFIVERISETDQTIRCRQFVKNKEQAFFVPTNFSKMILDNSFFKLLLEHSLEAGCTLSLLYDINRMGDLRNACNVIEDKLYNVFIEDILKYLDTLHSDIENISDDETENIEQSNIHKDENSAEYSNDELDKDSNKEFGELNLPILSKFTTNDEFLLSAFSLNMNLSMKNDSEDICDGEFMNSNSKNECIESQELNALYILERIAKSKHILPLEEVILNCLNRILKTRIAFADSFVIRLYREEFDILKHLGNIRKILLLEASDVMELFYYKLFQQIELGETWANSFLLTTQLNDIICAKFPEMSSLFGVEIDSTFRCQTEKVYEAVEELFLNYNLSIELGHIITQEDIKEYNKIFRFLLKVKWALMVLEKLRFPRSYKRNTPFAPFEMVDLLMRRLQQLRFWMIYSMKNIHFHLMTHVLQSMGQQLDGKIVNCKNLNEIQAVHRLYLNTVCEHCFLVEKYSAIKLGVEQLVNLTFIIRLEWNGCVQYIEGNNNPLSNVDPNESAADIDFITNSQIDAIELTYIRCHQYLANKLNNEVYMKQQSFLLGLSAAFNTSLPY